MPLHAEYECRVGEFHPLDHAVGAMSRRDESVAKTVDRLMMDRLHRHRVDVMDRVKTCPLPNRDRMFDGAEPWSAMRHVFAYAVWQMRDEIASKGNVEHLHAAANT